jgi:hypothetical protein
MRSHRIAYDPPPPSSSQSAQLAYHDAVRSIDQNSPAVKSTSSRTPGNERPEVGA